MWPNHRYYDLLRLCLVKVVSFFKMTSRDHCVSIFLESFGVNEESRVLGARGDDEFPTPRASDRLVFVCSLTIPGDLELVFFCLRGYGSSLLQEGPFGGVCVLPLWKILFIRQDRRSSRFRPLLWSRKQKGVRVSGQGPRFSLRFSFLLPILSVTPTFSLSLITITPLLNLGSSTPCPSSCTHFFFPVH